MTRPLPLIVAILIAVVTLTRAILQPTIGDSDIDRPSIMLADRMITATAGPADQSGRAPGYALILAALARTSADAQQGLRCLASPTPGCSAGWFLGTVAVTQTIMELAALGLVAYLALLLSGSINVALLTVAIAFFGTRYGQYTGFVKPFVCYHLLSHVFLAATIWAARSGSAARWLVSGASVAAMGAFEPQALIAAPVLLALIASGTWQPLVATTAKLPSVARGCGLPMFAFTCGFGSTLLALAALSGNVDYPPEQWTGQLAGNLAERVAFNAINPPTWLTGLLQPVPFLGRLAHLIAPEASLLQLSNYIPGAFVHDGVTRIRLEALADGRDGPAQLRWLFDTYIVANPLGYLVSIPTVFIRGLWAGTAIVGLVGVFRLPQLRRWSAIEGRGRLLALAFLPAVAIFLSNTALTANLFILNPLMPTLYCYAIAYIARSP